MNERIIVGPARLARKKIARHGVTFRGISHPLHDLAPHRLTHEGVAGASNMTAETAMKALPDGYTLLLDRNSLWFTSLMQNTPYDVLRDFSPITLVLSSPTILVVHPSAAANSVKELIALAKAKPGALNYGSAGYASAPHFAMELLKSMMGQRS